jgi:hypothetical protein
MKVPPFFTVFRIVFAVLLFFTQSNNLYSQAWNYVGGEPDFTTGGTAFISFASNNNTPYIAFRDASVTNKLTVEKFDGTNWVTVGAAGFSTGTVTYTSIAFNGNTPYVAYEDATLGRLVVRQFDGTNWVPVGSSGGITSSSASYISLAFNGSIPYVAYDDGATQKATVMQFDGTNWIAVGSSAGFSNGVATYTSFAINNGIPYVAYEDATFGKLVVVKFDGANWVAVGSSAGISSGAAAYTSLAFNGNTPYVAYRDGGLSSKTVVMQFDGANWVAVGSSTGISSGIASYVSLATNGSTPYVVYQDAGYAKLVAMKFDGSNWVAVGSANGISPSSTTYSSIAFNGSIPYVAYSNTASSGKANVIKFDVTPATGLYFDGTNDFVRVPDNNTLDFGGNDFTVECWTKKLANSSSYSNSSITGKWNTGASPGTNEWLLQNTSDGNTNVPAFLIESGITTYTVAGTTPMTLNTWYHLAAVRQGASLKLYVNGVLQNSITIPANTIVNNAGQNLYVAAFRFTSGPVIYSKIRIDELRIWNRALCQGEIQNNMNGELSASGQTGLIALYGFNQGNVGDNNTTVTTLTDASGNGNNGTLWNMALNGLTSNWYVGKATGTTSTYTPLGMAATTGGSRVCQSAIVQTPGTIYQDASCNLIARVSPSGAGPVSGTVNTCVIIDGSVQTYNGQPYVQRHYDIEPATGAGTATATITLTFTQAEFDAFNTARGSLPALPTGSADATGIANLRITQYHGAGTAPGNYPGSTEVIDPANTNIVWNATLSRWEVTFNVTGFSGFYVTSDATALPIKLSAFTGSKTQSTNLLTWTTSEESNTDHFEVERNTGNGFVQIGAVKASRNTSTDTRYTFEDPHPADGTNQYRLKTVDLDGRYEYSRVITLKSDGTTNISLYPNPTQNRLYVAGAANGATYQVKNISGQVLTSGRLSYTGGINVSTLTTGIYVLTVDGQPFKFFKR